MAKQSLNVKPNLAQQERKKGKYKKEKNWENEEIK